MRLRILTALLLTGVAFPAWADKRVALVFGADKYQSIRPLDNAANDAAAVEEALDKLGFEVSLETNRDLKRMRRALEDFQEDAEGADVALVYFAGHGVEIAGENRLLPTDADASSVDKLKATSLPLQDVQQALAKVSKVNLVLLDACRNDPFGGAGGDAKGEANRGAVSLAPTSQVKQITPGLGRLGSAENLLYTFSAAPGATAADGSGDNSPFTAALVKYLDTDGLEIRSVMTLVQQEVYDLSRGSQLPYVENGLPQVFFAATQKSDLPERERLLLAMADVTPDLRNEIERLSGEKDVPLAPLYGALISSDAKALSQEQRLAKLNEAADAFVATREQIRTMASSDPQVATLRDEAETQLALGAFDAARGKLADAAQIDATSREALKTNFVERTASEAATHIIAGGASRTNLKYDLAIDSYTKAAALFDEVERDGLGADQRKQQLASLDALGDLYLTVGNLAEGRKAIERQQAIATRMAEKEPDNALWQGDVAASTFKLAGVLSDQGESTTALAAYEKALGIRQALALADPQNADKRALQASAQLQIGALYKLQGDNARALASYEAARDIVSKLADARPDSEALRATLMRSLRLIGEIQQEAKQYKEAAASYRAELDLAEKLAAAKPDDPARQAHLADAYQDIGSIENDLIDRSKYTETGTEPALAAFNRSIDISRALIAADARNAAYQRQLAMTLGKLGMLRYFGDSNITRDDSEAARNAFQEAIEINERLVAADPGNKLWVGDMVGAYESMATWNEFQPDEQAALSYTKKAHQSALQLAALDPKNVAWQRKASLYHAKIAESYIQMKDYKAALDYEIKGLEYAIGVARANPGLPVYFNDVSAVQSRISRIYWIQKDMNNYWAQNDTLLEQTKRNVGRFPEDADALEHLYRAYVTVAKSWTKNEPDKAIGLFRDSLAVAQKAAALYPDDVRHLSGIYEAEINAAYVIEQKGDRQAAHDAYAAALATARRRVALKSGDAGYEAGVAHAQARLDIVDSGQPPPKFD